MTDPNNADVANVFAEAAIRGLLRDIDELRTAVADAREILDGDDREEAHRWVEVHGHLADLPLDIEVEEDDDSTDEPEGPYAEREEGGADE